MVQTMVDLKTHTSQLIPSAMGSVLHPFETSLRIKKKHFCELYFLLRMAFVPFEVHAILHVSVQ